MRKLGTLIGITLIAVAGHAGMATAATPASIFGGDITCGEVTDEGSGGGIVTTSLGQVWCGTVRPADNINSTTDTPLETVRSTVKSFDGVPLDVNFALPDATEFGPPPYPAVALFHGYGGFRYRFKDMQRWLDKGYAAYSLTQRGFDESCLTAGSKAADPAGCAKGYIHLIDQRYEIRDSQEFLGELVDEGLVEPDRIAAIGTSYGGGTSVEFAALKDRMMMPDGSLVPWESPMGAHLSIAVATPTVPPTELSNVLAPNGSNIDYLEDAGYYGRPGILKESWVQGLIAAGFVSPSGTDPTADILGWYGLYADGEPYDDVPGIADLITELNRFHSPYGVDHSEAPAPMMISAGYSDDLVPVNEETRYYNRTRAQYPNSPISLFFGSLGHQRGQQQPEVAAASRVIEDDWVDYYLADEGPKPPSDVVSYTQTCPNGELAGGPYTASDWASISPGEIRLEDSADQVISPDGGDLAIGAAWNSITAGQNPCGTQPGAAEAGSANYVTDPAPAGGYTMQGAPTIVAKVKMDSPDSEIAARLVDLSADGTQKILIARGLWRPNASGFQVTQLFANAWKVEAGHRLRLELLPRDAAQKAPGGVLSNYGRPSNNQQPVTIQNMDLRLPVVEAPGSLNGLVKAPAKKVLPDRPGAKLARGYGAIGSETLAAYKARVEPLCPPSQNGTPPSCLIVDPQGTPFVKGKVIVKGKVLKAKIRCKSGNGTRSYEGCFNIKLAFKGAPKKGKKGKGLAIALARKVTASPGQTRTATLKLTRKARKFFKDRRKRGKKVRGPNSLRAKVLVNGRSKGFKTVRRVGRVR